MESVDITAFVTFTGLLVSACSISAFLLGRKKEATTEAKTAGILENQLLSVHRQVTDTRDAIKDLGAKIDRADEKREHEYRELLVKVTQLESSYKSIHHRMDAMEQSIKNHQ